jgi:hypothetical protein
MSDFVIKKTAFLPPLSPLGAKNAVIRGSGKTFCFFK